MAEEKFKLPNSSYEELTKIIKSYGHFDAPVGLDEVSKLIGMDRTIISRNSGFLIELGILEAGKKKTTSNIGRELSQALEHEMPDEMRNCWRKIVFENEFISKLITAIKIRNGMDDNTLQSHIAYSAGQPKKPQFMTGARTIIDILRAAELIEESEGKYVVSTTDSLGSDTSNENIKESISTSADRSISRPAPFSTKFIETGDAQIKINVNVTVNCTVAELDSLGEKLRRVIDEIKSGKTDLEDNSKDQ